MSGRNKLAVKAYDGLFQNVVRLLEDARGSTARAVNTIITATYWEIGQRIVVHEQQGKKRAGYGEAIIEKLARPDGQIWAGIFSTQHFPNAGILPVLANFADSVCRIE